LEDKLKRYSIANTNTGDRREGSQEPVLILPSSSISSGVVIPSYPRLVALLLDPVTGIRLSDKKHRFKSYFRCFSGRELIDWLMINLPSVASSRSIGMEIGNQLIHCGYIEPLNSTLVFLDSEIGFYAFTNQVDKSLPVHRLNPKHVSSLSEDSNSSDFEERNFDHEEEQTSPFIPEPRISSSNDSSNRHTISVSSRSTNSSNINVQTTTISNEVREGTSKIYMSSHEDPEPKPKRKVSPLFQNFMNEMRDPNTGISIKDRKQHLSARSYTTFHKCFLGSDAVDWIVKKMNLEDRKLAVKIGKKMIEGDIIHHVLDKLPFLDSDDFYRFRVDD